MAMTMVRIPDKRDEGRGSCRVCDSSPRLVHAFLYIFRDTNHDVFSYSVSMATATTTTIMEMMAGLEARLKDQGD